jgi:hypothetical protein
VRSRNVWRIVALAAVTALVVSATATAATVKWALWTNPDKGFHIAIPETWFVVPNTVAGVKGDVTKLAKENAAQVAAVYTDLISTSKARTALERDSFQAFAYADLPTLTDVTVTVARTKATYTSAKGLTLVASAGKAGKIVPGKIETARVVKLPGGPAAYIDGTRATTAGTVDFALYVFGRGTDLYEVYFVAAATGPDIAATSKTIAAIAQSFAFT